MVQIKWIEWTLKASKRRRILGNSDNGRWRRNEKSPEGAHKRERGEKPHHQ